MIIKASAALREKVLQAEQERINEAKTLSSLEARKDYTELFR